MKFLVCIFSVVIATAQTAPAEEDPRPHLVHDQKQTGENNFQLHLKDISIVAFLGDDILGDYDYNYDYSDFTVKPPGGNATSTTEGTSPTPESPSTEKPVESTTSEKASTTEKVDSVSYSTSSPDKIKVQIIEDPNIPIVPVDDVGATHAAFLGESVQIRKCANGYTRDKRGRCRRVRRPGHHNQFDFTRLASNLASRIRGEKAS